MKNTIKILVAVTLLFTQINAFSLFGTSVDEATVEMQIVQNAEQLLQTAEQIKHTEQLIKQTIAQTGIRDVIGFAQEMKKFHNFLKNYSLDLMDLTDDIIDNPKSQIGKYAKELFTKYELFNDCNYDYMNDDMKRICKNRMIRQVQEIATYQEISKTLKKFGDNIKTLAQKRASSNNVKESADIANAIQIELAQLQVLKTQIDMMESQNKAKERVDMRQTEQMIKEKWENSGSFIDQEFIK
ncbi:MAG: type IV secretion system protein [Candidatus Desulfofervidus auxilii]|nr:type IV secretion system protein [Candidatus Desulfofervidus auxilii]